MNGDSFTNNFNKPVNFRVLAQPQSTILIAILTIVIPVFGLQTTFAFQAAPNDKIAENLIPAAPSAVSGVAGSASHIVLKWTDNSNNETGFKIERRKTNGDAWQYLGRAPANANGFESVGLLGDTTYDHRVYAYNDYGISTRAASAPVTTLNVPAKSPGKIIVPATAETVRNGEGTFVKLSNNRLMLVYSAFAGVSDLALSRIAAKISVDNGETWSAERVIFSDPKISLLLPSTIRMNNGEIGIAYSKLLSASSAVKVFRFSKDEGETWSDEIRLSDVSFGYMTGSHDRLLKLANNRLLNLVHAKMPGINTGTHLGTHVFASDDNGRTWRRKTAEPLAVPANPFDKSEYGFWETTAVEAAPNQIYLLGRTATGWLYESRSIDAGDSWSAPTQSNIFNPLTPARLDKILGTNTLVIIRNPYTNMTEAWHGGNRFILASQTSDDNGLTWKNYKEIFYDQSGNWYDYPAVFWDKNTLHITCRDITRSRETWKSINIRHIALSKEWLTQPAATVANR